MSCLVCRYKAESQFTLLRNTICQWWSAVSKVTQECCHPSLAVCLAVVLCLMVSLRATFEKFSVTSHSKASLALGLSVTRKWVTYSLLWFPGRQRMTVVHEEKDALAAVCLGLSSMGGNTAKSQSRYPLRTEGWSVAGIEVILECGSVKDDDPLFRADEFSVHNTLEPCYLPPTPSYASVILAGISKL